MNASLHNTQAAAVSVSFFKKDETDAFSRSFASVTAKDDSGNEVHLFFTDWADVQEFAMNLLKKEKEAFKKTIA